MFLRGLILYISMKQPLGIYRDNGFFELYHKCFPRRIKLKKIKLKSKNTCICNLYLYESVRYIRFLVVWVLWSFWLKSEFYFFVVIQAKSLHQTRFLDLLPWSFRGKIHIFIDFEMKDFNDKRLSFRQKKN